MTENILYYNCDLCDNCHGSWYISDFVNHKYEFVQFQKHWSLEHRRSWLVYTKFYCSVSFRLPEPLSWVETAQHWKRTKLETSICIMYLMNSVHVGVYQMYVDVQPISLCLTALTNVKRIIQERIRQIENDRERKETMKYQLSNPSSSIFFPIKLSRILTNNS